MDARLAGIVLANAAVMAAVLFLVVWPLCGWLVLAGLVVGAVGAVAIMLHDLVTGAAPLLGPDDVNDSTLFPTHRCAYGRDRAWPHYLARQARTDLGSAVGRVRERNAQGWSVLGLLDDVEVPPAAAPAVFAVLVPPLILGAAVTAGAVVGVLAAVAVLVPALLVALAVWGGAGAALRGGDARLRRRNRAEARCPSCFWATTLPGYPCDCGEVHHDVRPSRLGVLWHRCRCGRPIPTTVSRAGALHAPQCPQCGRALTAGSGVLTDVSVPVFGPVSAGKTSLIYASLAALDDLVTTAGGRLTARGGDGQERYRDGVDAVRAGPVAKTSADEPPVGLVVEVSCGGRTALLHTFDAAGEEFVDRERSTAMRFLDHTEALVLVVDPFSIPRVADAVLRGTGRAVDVAPASAPPETAYRATVLRLRDHGVPLTDVRLAVVVVKADLLAGEPVARGLSTDSDSVRAWLVDHGEDHLVLQAGRDFREVAYFLVSSRNGTRSTAALTALAPLRWLAGHGRMPLPAPTSRPAARRSTAGAAS